MSLGAGLREESNESAAALAEKDKDVEEVIPPQDEPVPHQTDSKAEAVPLEISKEEAAMSLETSSKNEAKSFEASRKEETVPLGRNSEDPSNTEKPVEQLPTNEATESKLEAKHEESETPSEADSTQQKDRISPKTVPDSVAAKDKDLFKKPQEPPNDKDEGNGVATAAAGAGANFSDYAEHVTYGEDGSATYTDPKTKIQYKWCEEDNNWIPLAAPEANGAGDGDAKNPYENEHYIWCHETRSWKPKATQTETEHYKWDAEKNAWIPKQKTESQGSESTTYSVDEDGQRIYTDKDGTVFFWDEEKSAWFPKIDDDFMARYQMNYGFIDNVSAGEEEKRKKLEEEEKRRAEELKRMSEEAREAMESSSAASTSAGMKRKANQEPPKWFDIDAEHNTKVYVSNLPLDITLDEFAELMGKCGLIMRDPKTQKFKLKLYTEADGQIKGDGLCDYIKVESVKLALSILDEYVYRGHKIRVQRAEFQMRGEYNPALKPKRKKKDKEKLQKMKEKLFDWRPEKLRGERTKNEKIVIIKNLFTPEIFEKEVQLILDYQNDLREECSKVGTVRKVVIYDCHPEGVAQVNMASPEEADLVIQMMQGRYFGERQISAEHWDGKTKYKTTESEKDEQQRLSNWDQFLEAEAENAEKKEVTC